jgi:hypothetical protein
LPPVGKSFAGAIIMSPVYEVSDSVSIRPTENYAENKFWTFVCGRDIDFQTLSTDKEAYADYVRKISGLHTLEIEFLTYGPFRWVFNEQIRGITH